MGVLELYLLVAGPPHGYVGLFGLALGARAFAGAPFGWGITHDQIDPLVASKIPNYFRIHPRDRFEFTRPVALVVRPGEPGGFVRLPLGGHAESALRFSCAHRSVSPGGDTETRGIFTERVS